MGKAAKSGGKKTMTKSAFVTHLADKTALTKKQVEAVLNEIVETVKGQLGSKGPGKFVFPGLARLTLTKMKAVKGGVEKINPLTGQPYITKDKPAYNKVNMRPIKAVKEALK
jgi:nucleoid DNA-binding protein